MAANVVFGVQFGAVGALVNAWPAISFVVSSEILVGMMRGTRTYPAPTRPSWTVPQRHLSRS